jgi:hypothetical protein
MLPAWHKPACGGSAEGGQSRAAGPSTASSAGSVAGESSSSPSSPSAIIFFEAQVQVPGLALVAIFFYAHVPVFGLARVAFVPLGNPRDDRRKDPFPACHTVSNRISSLFGTVRASLFLLPHKTLMASSARTVLI